jgi:uncharacterized protein YdeI (YjbR/CyaY-like superfamily)
MPTPALPELEILEFATPGAWRDWLDANHGRQEGIWMRLANKSAAKPTITYAEALDGALCYGWIDGQMAKKTDPESDWRLQKFTPRRARSLWSKRNREHVARLEAAGLMRDAGRAEIERAIADGRWDAAYDKPSDMKVPPDFLKKLAQYPEAQAFFNTLSKGNTYAIAWRLQTAKQPATRERRFDALLAMLIRGEKPH